MYRYGYGIPSPQKFSGPVVMEPEALALFAAMGVQLSDADKLSYNTYIAGLKSAGIWAELDVLWCMWTPDFQQAHLNFKNPGVTFSLVPVNAPTHTPRSGYAGNGTNSRLGTGYVPNTDGVKYLANDNGMFVYVTVSAKEDKDDLGSRETTGALTWNTLRSHSLGDRCATWVNSLQAGNLNPVVATALGMSAGIRTASNSVHVYRDGVLLQTGAVNGTGRPVLEQFICASNGLTFGTRRIGMAAFGSGAAMQSRMVQFYALTHAFGTAMGASLGPLGGFLRRLLPPLLLLPPTAP